MKYIVILFILLVSCSKKEKIKTEPKFEKTKYDRSYNYKDSLVQKIIPNKDYDYYAYVTIRGQDHNIISEKGDILEKHKFETKLKDGSLGFFIGCHPNWCSDYIITIKNNYLHFIISETEASIFLGTIDNLEEALLLAKLKGYNLDNDIRGNSYRVTDKGYEMILMKFSNFPLQKESMEVIVDKNGNIESKSLGIYARGKEAYE
jgi:hypothetical protein